MRDDYDVHHYTALAPILDKAIKSGPLRSSRPGWYRKI
jgi:hypothetical protein